FLLPVTVSPEFLEKLMNAVELNPACTICVDLVQQKISIVETGESEQFDINPYKKECLLNGYDDIDYLLSIKDKIEEYEQQREKI
ncbi:MAG TPA: hypothetical protein VLA58_08390, partial [Chitinophagaceae bacterium]|nr:hypothetical protein [Chitinophagaceae bacterium]